MTSPHAADGEVLTDTAMTVTPSASQPAQHQETAPGDTMDFDFTAAGNAAVLQSNATTCEQDERQSEDKPDEVESNLTALPINSGLNDLGTHPIVPNVLAMDAPAAFVTQYENNSAVAIPPNTTAFTSGVPTIPTTATGVAPLMRLPASDEPPPRLEEREDVRPSQPATIAAYAKLQFPDGTFFMSTPSVILGRDIRAHRAAILREQMLALKNNPALGTDVAGAPLSGKHGSKHTKSVVSESGGIMRQGDDSDSGKRSEKRRNKSESSGSSARRGSMNQVPSAKVDYEPQSYVPQIDPHARVYAPNSAAAVPVDPEALRPSSNHTPIIGVHPRDSAKASSYKALSRQHIKIAHNGRKDVWEAEVLGRNGAFVDEIFFMHKEIATLKSNSLITIGAVSFHFILPEVAAPKASQEYDDDIQWDEDENFYLTPEGGRLSGHFERHHNGNESDSSAEDDMESDGSDGSDVESDINRPTRPRREVLLSPNDDSYKRIRAKESGGDENEDSDDSQAHNDEEEDGEEDEEDIAQYENDEDDVAEAEDQPVVQEPVPKPPKRKGPGRPPKGEFSKREMKEMKLAQEEKDRLAMQGAKKAGNQPVPTQKNKVGRPRKNPLLENTLVKPEKRKYTRRKPLYPDANKQEGDEDKPSKEKKDKKLPKPPRSPSPVFVESELTEEQKTKPTQNYVQLIAEVLKARGKPLSLPQIYREIQRRYPYFVVKTQTNGWQSSVRHNLSQHNAFTKHVKDGKGWLWVLNEAIPIEREKPKRQRTPPLQGPSYHQAIYPGAHHSIPGQPGMMAPPPPGYQQLHLMPGQPPYGQPNGYGIPTPQPQVNGQAAGYSIGGSLPQHPGQSGGTYRSPYDPKPPVNPPLQPSYHARQPAPPPMPQHLTRPAPQQQTNPFINEEITRAIDNFKNSMRDGMKGYHVENVEAIIASAISRVLGHSIRSAFGGTESMEEKIVPALSGVIARLPGGDEALQWAKNHTAVHASDPPTLPHATPLPPQGPSLPNGTLISVPRPSMTHNMTRTNSGTPLNRPATASNSPAPASAVPDTAMVANASLKFSVSPISPVKAEVPGSVGMDPVPTGQISSDLIAPPAQVHVVASSQQLPTMDMNMNGKRHRSEDENVLGEPSFKRREPEDVKEMNQTEFKSAAPGVTA